MPIAKIPVEKLEAFMRERWPSNLIDTKKPEAERRRAVACAFYSRRQVYPGMEDDLPEKTFDILRFRQLVSEDRYRPFVPMHDEEYFMRNLNSFRGMQKEINEALGVSL